VPQVFNSVSQMQMQVGEWHRAGQRIALVPTMGNLHRGHLSLVEKAVTQADKVVVSIFVNPLQFNDKKDFNNYPRTLPHDLEALAALPVDAVFTPAENAMYPRGQAQHCIVELPVMVDVLEGAQRPGHFRGVTTLVAKLFNIVQPQLAVFGEKDYQQLLLVRRMVEDLCLPIEIVAMPTCREADGLAMSSRNSRLAASERRIAPRLYQVLQQVAQALKQSQADFAQLEANAEQQLSQAGFEPEYVAIRDCEDLAEPNPTDTNPTDTNQSLVVLAAALLGRRGEQSGTRLIDNLRV